MTVRRLHPDDDVAVALAGLPAGVSVTVEGMPPLTTRAAIPFGHKVALRAIAPGDLVRKYGEVIGRATAPIHPGDHVHTHNLASSPTPPHSHTPAPSPLRLRSGQASASLPVPETFPGYPRPTGPAGCRNYVAVIPASLCANEVARRIVDGFPGAVALPHGHGCCQMGADLATTRRTLAGLSRHPNVAAALVVGLGCETLSATDLAADVASARPVETLVIQEAGGSRRAIERGRALLQSLLADAARLQRVPCPTSDLLLATECGGSDATSGLAANPLVGRAADAVVGAGGTVLLSEAAELMGAEHILARRAVSAEVGQRIWEITAAAEVVAKELGTDLRGAQPTPGNMAGGITTIEEKSLGCIYKAGTAPIQGVLDYAETPPGRGLYVMDTPGQDAESVTGMVAGGAQVVVFTTGRGTPLGFPIAPVLKLTANARTWASQRDDLDFSAAGLIQGTEQMEELARALLNQLWAVLAGEPTAAECLGSGEVAIHRLARTV